MMSAPDSGGVSSKQGGGSSGAQKNGFRYKQGAALQRNSTKENLCIILNVKSRSDAILVADVNAAMFLNPGRDATTTIMLVIS